ncbi:DUF418 domain-containing protein [Persicobacter diffluens]|uniref:Membrane protein n=1 Tax=Persicobacter diffluens TaxID=981 RepID=A0AAN4W2Z2_9BACT|nr:membrane protein [Persicobacter diffluens]
MNNQADSGTLLADTGTEPKSSKRIEIVDVLRGFAILVIMLLHNIEHFNFYFFPDKAGQADWLNALDKNIWDSMFFLFGGKTYSIFAILFGFTFSLMFLKQQQQGIDFGKRYLWRLLLLAGFACFNAMFFPGEVLMLYAITGVSLYFVRNWSNKSLFFIALFFLSQPWEWFNYIKYVSIADFSLPKQINSQYWKPVMEALHSDSIWITFKSNITTGQWWSLLWAIENGRFTQTIGLFMVGFLIGKKGLFGSHFYDFWKKVLPLAILFCIPLFYTKLHFQGVDEVTIKRTLGVIFDMWWKLSFTFIWVSLFILLYKFSFFQKLTAPLKTYGKMSMTNYITQSIFGGILYFGYGFYLAKTCGTTISFSIGLIMLVVQMICCHYWIKKYKQGPFEKLWHKLTWIK